jgi:hypothetical protein
MSRMWIALTIGVAIGAYVIHRGQPRCPQCNDKYCIVYMAGIDR